MLGYLAFGLYLVLYPTIFGAIMYSATRKVTTIRGATMVVIIRPLIGGLIIGCVFSATLIALGVLLVQGTLRLDYRLNRDVVILVLLHAMLLQNIGVVDK